MNIELNKYNIDSYLKKNKNLYDEDDKILLNKIVKKYKNVSFIKFYNIFHLGDNVFNIHFFNKISDYLKKNTIHILYYLKSEYIFQVSQFIKSNNIHLIKMDLKQFDPNTTHLWIGNKCLTINIKESPIGSRYNLFLVEFFNYICANVFKHSSLQIKDIAYEDEDLIHRYEKLPDKYKDVDVLIVNSLPLSKQFNYVESEWEDIIDIFSKNYKTVITKKINSTIHEGFNCICTLDDNLTIKDIGALSTKVKLIIAVNTGVVTALLNTYTLNNVLHVCILDKQLYYTYPKFSNYKSLKEIDIDKLIKMLDDSNIHKS